VLPTRSTVPGHSRIFFIRALGVGQKWNPIPPTARPCSTRHLIAEAKGIPLALILTGANRNDVTQLQALVYAILPIGGKRGRS